MQYTTRDNEILDELIYLYMEFLYRISVSTAMDAGPKFNFAVDCFALQGDVGNFPGALQRMIEIEIPDSANCVALEEIRRKIIDLLNETTGYVVDMFLTIVDGAAKAAKDKLGNFSAKSNLTGLLNILAASLKAEQDKARKSVQWVTTDSNSIIKNLKLILSGKTVQSAGEINKQKLIIEEKKKRSAFKIKFNEYCLEEYIVIKNPNDFLNIDKNLRIRIIKEKKKALKDIGNDVFHNLIIARRNGRLGIAYLICDMFHVLDPVIGDACCQNRPSFILDMNILIEGELLGCGLSKNALCQSAIAYISYWSKFHDILIAEFDKSVLDGFNESNTSPYESNEYCKLSLEFFGGECNNGTGDFFNFCDHLFTVMSPDFVEYIGLCKVMTRTRNMLYDRYGVSLGDTQVNLYPSRMRGHYKRRLGQLSVQYIRDMSNSLLPQVPDTNHICTQLHQELLTCDAELQTDGTDLPIIPIYSCLRTILAYEAAKGRPIVITLNRFQVLNSGVTFTPKVYYYKPQGGLYVLDKDPSKGDLDVPCMAFECYSIYNETDQIVLQDGSNIALFGQDDDAFFAAFESCDIVNLIMLYAASHPLMSTRGRVRNSIGQTFDQDTGFAYVTSLQSGICHGVPHIGFDTLTMNTMMSCNLLSAGNLSEEFISYRDKSKICGMLIDGKMITYHLDRDDTSESRYDGSVFFRVSHILPSTAAKVLERVEKAILSAQTYNGWNIVQTNNPAPSIDLAIESNVDTYIRDDNEDPH